MDHQKFKLRQFRLKGQREHDHKEVPVEGQLRGHPEMDTREQGRDTDTSAYLFQLEFHFGFITLTKKIIKTITFKP